MEVLRKPNIFAVIITMVALASLIQLGSLNNVMFNGEKLSELVRGLSWLQTSDSCTTTCGTEATTATEDTKFKPERIVIKDIHMDMKVVSVPLKNGTWEVKEAVANYAEGTSLVNQKEGNVGIFGHAQANAFLPIKELKKGSDIVIYGQGYRATYKVSTTALVTPDQVDVFYPQGKPVLTLITCDGPADTHRYMIRAELVTIVGD